MKLLQQLLEAASARDIRTYYGHCKRALKSNPKFAKGKLGRGAFAAVVHDVAENDPDSNIDTAAIITGVFAKYKEEHSEKPVAEGFSGAPGEKSPLSSKNRDFTPNGEAGDDVGAPAGDAPNLDKDMDDDTDADMGQDSDVQELKDLRTKDIGDKLTPEQQKELQELRADQGGSGDCDDEDCDDEFSGMSSDSPAASSETVNSRMQESAAPLMGKVKEALKRREAKGANKAEEEEEEVPAKKKTIGRDLDESAKAERAKRLAEMSTSILSSIAKKDGSFLK